MAEFVKLGLKISKQAVQTDPVPEPPSTPPPEQTELDIKEAWLYLFKYSKAYGLKQVTVDHSQDGQTIISLEVYPFNKPGMEGLQQAVYELKGM